MDAISVTAILKPKEQLAERLLEELQKVQKASRQEAGCLDYTLHQSVEDETFVLHEKWQDMDALASHIASSHYEEYRNNIAELVSAREVYKLKVL